MGRQPPDDDFAVGARMAGGTTHEIGTRTWRADHVRVLPTEEPETYTNAVALMQFFRDSLEAELWSRNCQVVGDPANFIKQLVKLRKQSGVTYDDQRAMMEGFFIEVRAGSVPIDKRDLWKVFLARRQKYMRGRVVVEQTTRKVPERIHH